MNISAIGSSNNAYASALQQPQQAQPLNAAPQAGREGQKDGDKDDGAKAVQAPAPTVNLNGQTVGGLINVTA